MSDSSPREGAADSGSQAPESLGLPRAVLRLMRPRQWVKNILLFAALVFAKRLFDGPAVALAALGFAGFCLASSSVYVLNDLVDVERDRRHPEKRHRPIANGSVSPAVALLLTALLTAAALAISFRIGSDFGQVTLIYIGITHFYSLAGKNAVILDVMLIAAGFVIRAIAGALAIDVPFSDWFIACTMFLALFLALSKRKAEMLALNEAAPDTRPVLERYTPSALTAFTATAMAAALISYALYVVDTQKQPGMDSPLLWLTVPFALFGLFRYHLLVETAGLGEKPEEAVLLDRPFQICVLGFAAVAIAALYLKG